MNKNPLSDDKQLEEKPSDTYDYYDYNEESEEYTHVFSVDLFRIMSLLMTFEDAKGLICDSEVIASNSRKKDLDKFKTIV